ncbi:hypothetical protein V1463_01315 [Micrococcus yunnanensis]|uniref:hypothetical protein n=1 Tax=Micrococcus yunnanensis TaxID=566027 RepID=UPI00300E1B21
MAPEKRTRRPAIKLYGGRISINAPTESKPYYRVNHRDSVTGKTHNYNGAKTLDEAKALAASLVGDDTRTVTDSPTLAAAYEQWAASTAWTDRSRDNYRYQFGHLAPLHDLPISALRPLDLARIPSHTLSYQNAQKLRTIVRGLLNYAAPWVEGNPMDYAQAIRLPRPPANRTTRAASDTAAPSLAYANNLLRLCFNPHTRAADDIYETLQREKYSGFTYVPAPSFADTSALHDADLFRAGLPRAITDQHMRGTPKHYKNLEAHTARQRDEIAQINRDTAAAFALGIGAGLRIGEILGLRMNHLLTMDDIIPLYYLTPEQQWEHINDAWNGFIRVDTQASQQSKGKIIVSAPKMRRTRIASLPPFLPANRFKKLAIPSQTAISRTEALTLWDDHGTAPLRAIVIDRLASIATLATGNTTEEEWHTSRATDTLNALLFPTRSPARRGRDGQPSAIPDPAYYGITSPCPITRGGYYSQAGWAKRSNELFDYTSDLMEEAPPAPRGATSRTGYTHHSLRHFAISMRLYDGQDAASVAKEMGHKNAAFTYERYAWAIKANQPAYTFTA